MKFIVLSLFPKMFEGFLSESMIGRAQRNKKIKIEIYELSKWGIGRWNKVDDTPYGGGPGMVLRVDVVTKAIEDIKADYRKKTKKLKNNNRKLKTILLTPQGKKYDQRMAKKFAESKEDLLLICGHYEGFDERIRDYVDLEISIGDFVLTGGELAAAMIIDSTARLISGVLGKEASHKEDSFSIKNKNLLKYPQYTRPEEFDGKKVPIILKGGNHQEIEKWREKTALDRTKEKRPDLF